MIKCLLKAFQIGVIAGMRTMTAPALVSYKLSHTNSNENVGPALRDSRLHFLTSPVATNVLAVMAVGELVADKLPGTPDRTGQPQVWGRIGSGALSAAALTKADGNSASIGALVGALGAAAGAFTFFQVRRWLTHEKELPDLWVALAEDALTIGAGWLVVQQD